MNLREGDMRTTIWQDRSDRPRVTLAANGMEHDVVFVQVEPTVFGWCATCAGQFSDPRVADRKAGSCELMVQYLSEINRSRRLRLALIGEIQELRATSMGRPSVTAD